MRNLRSSVASRNSGRERDGVVVEPSAKKGGIVPTEDTPITNIGPLTTLLKKDAANLGTTAAPHENELTPDRLPVTPTPMRALLLDPT